MRKLSSGQTGIVIFFLVIAAGMLLDSWPLYRHCRVMEAVMPAKKQLLLALQTREHADAVRYQSVSHPPSSLLQLMTDAGQESGMNLISFLHVPLEAGQAIFRERASCQFSGTYQQAMTMMHALSAAASAVLLRDFTLQLSDQGDYRLQTEVLLSNRVMHQQAKEQIGQLNNPFCAGDDGLPVNQQEEVAVLRADAISGMQMLAYLSQGEERIAWLRLSDGHLVSVQRGAVIGHERAVVKMIEQTGVILIDAAGRRYRIRRPGEMN